MIQTIALLLLLIIGAGFVQANMSVMHSLSPLLVPGIAQNQLTYLLLLAAMGGALVLLWVVGLIDVALRRAQIRRQDAMILAKDRELMDIKTLVYDQQRPMLAEIKERLEAVARATRKMPPRIDETSPALRKRMDARAIREMFPPTGTRSATTGPL